MKKCIPLLFWILLLFPSTVLAEEQPLWELGIGVAGFYQPDYRGSDENRFYVLPFPYPIYRGDFFRAEGSRLSGLLFKSDRLRFDISLSGSLPVNSDDNQAREGMDDLDFTGEIGPSVEWKIYEHSSQSLWLKMPLRSVFDLDLDFRGLKFSPYLEYTSASLLLPGWRMSFSAGPIFGTERYHDYFYEVERAFVRPDRPEYHPSGGYSGSAISFGLGRSYNRFRVSAFTRYDHLSGAAFEDSPLVKTEHYWSVGMNVAWFFFKSKTMVKKPSSETTANPILQPERSD